MEERNRTNRGEAMIELTNIDMLKVLKDPYEAYEYLKAALNTDDIDQITWAIKLIWQSNFKENAHEHQHQSKTTLYLTSDARKHLAKVFMKEKKKDPSISKHDLVCKMILNYKGEV